MRFGSSDEPQRPSFGCPTASWDTSLEHFKKRRAAFDHRPQAHRRRLQPSAATAVGTDLLYAGVTKAVGTAVHGRNGAVSWRIVGLLAVDP
jgi:hypothetical protein